VASADIADFLSQRPRGVKTEGEVSSVTSSVDNGFLNIYSLI